MQHNKIHTQQGVQGHKTAITYTPLANIYFDILKGVKTKKSITDYRKLLASDTPKEKVLKVKSKLLAYRFSGIWKEGERSITRSTIKGLTGFVCLDFDKVHDIDKLMGLLKTGPLHPHLKLTFVSPGGNGVKAIVHAFDAIEGKESEDLCKIYTNAFAHTIYKAQEISELEGLDLVTKDATRLCFTSHDTNATYNENTTPLITGEIPEYKEKPNNKKSENDNALWECFRNSEKQDVWSVLTVLFGHADFKKGQIHNMFLQCCNYLFSKGIPHESLTQYRAEILENGVDENDITNCITSAFEYQQKELGAGLFWVSVISGKNETLTLKSNAKKTVEWLNGNGYVKLHIDGNNYRFLKKHGKRLKDIENDDAVYLELQKCLDEFTLYKKMTPGSYADVSKSIRSKQYVQMCLNDVVSISEKEIYVDTPNEAYVFYLNVMVKIDTEGAKIIQYANADKYVLESQVIDYTLPVKEKVDLCEAMKKMYVANENHWSRFLHNISCDSHDDPTNTSFLLSAIGYLLSNYKSPSNAKAIWFLDEGAQEGIREGGRGKSLVSEGIKVFKKSCMIQPQSSNADFLFSAVDKTHQLLIFDDAKKSILNPIFQAITNDLSVNPKGKEKFILPFSKSPKILITSNGLPSITGSSYARRIASYSFKAVYNAQHTPMHDFGIEFFNGWIGENKKQWAYFHYTMLLALSMFYKHGLRYSQAVNQEIQLSAYESQVSRHFPNNKPVQDEFNKLKEKLAGFQIQFITKDAIFSCCNVGQQEINSKFTDTSAGILLKSLLDICKSENPKFSYESVRIKEKRGYNIRSV